MIIETKFNLGQEVWGTSLHGSNQQVICPECLGKFEFKNPAGNTVQCFKCSYGTPGYIIEYVREQWHTHFLGRVGKIAPIRFKTQGEGRYDKDRVEYMCEITGVSSGTVWYEDNLFDSLEEADKETKYRNDHNVQA